MMMFRSRSFQIGVCAAAWLLAQAPQVRAETPVRASYGAPMSDDELAETRGGYLTAGGVVFDFGAVVRTFVDGELALETRLTWTPQGPVTEQAAGALPGWIPLTAGQIGGLDLSGLPAGAEGLVLNDASGTTALVHNVMNGQLQNLVINAADNRDIRQDMQLMLTLPNLEAMQRDFVMTRLGEQISQDMDWSSIRGPGS
jgi:hypothetical protein